MEIHLVSSMTSDDECRLAPAMLTAIGRILDRLPISYSVRIQTAAGNAIQHHHTATVPDPEERLATGTADIVQLFPKP
jgi:hypothetical protein